MLRRKTDSAYLENKTKREGKYLKLGLIREEQRERSKKKNEPAAS